METLYTRKQFAALIKVTTKTIYTLEKKGIIVPTTYINGRPRYTKESITETKKISPNGNNTN